MKKKLFGFFLSLFCLWGAMHAAAEDDLNERINFLKNKLGRLTVNISKEKVDWPGFNKKEAIQVLNDIEDYRNLTCFNGRFEKLRQYITSHSEYEGLLDKGQRVAKGLKDKLDTIYIVSY